MSAHERVNRYNTSAGQRQLTRISIYDVVSLYTLENPYKMLEMEKS